MGGPGVGIEAFGVLLPQRMIPDAGGNGPVGPGFARSAYTFMIANSVTTGGFMEDSQQPKIIIDSDWKAQAQAEKERLAAKEKEKEAQKPQAPGGAAGDAGAMPPADFMSLVGTLATQAILYLGGIPDPQTGRAIVSPDHARLYIDLLQVLETKTKGNLTAEESSELTAILNELRLRFVEINKAIAEAAKARAAGGVAENPAMRLRTPGS